MSENRWLERLQAAAAAGEARRQQHPTSSSASSSAPSPPPPAAPKGRQPVPVAEDIPQADEADEADAWLDAWQRAADASPRLDLPFPERVYLYRDVYALDLDAAINLALREQNPEPQLDVLDVIVTKILTLRRERAMELRAPTPPPPLLLTMREEEAKEIACSACGRRIWVLRRDHFEDTVCVRCHPACATCGGHVWAFRRDRWDEMVCAKCYPDLVRRR